MNFENFFEDKNNREALSMYTKEQRRAMAKACNDSTYKMRLKQMLSKETKDALGDVKITTISARHHQAIVGRELRPIIDFDVSTFFTTVNGVPWIIINTDVALMEVTVKHETIHLQQFLRGDLNFIASGTVWKGTLYPSELIATTTTPERIAYQWRELPWETEAYALQFSDAQIHHIFEHGQEQTISDLKEVLELYGRVVPEAPVKAMEVVEETAADLGTETDVVTTEES